MPSAEDTQTVSFSPSRLHPRPSQSMNGMEPGLSWRICSFISPEATDKSARTASLSGK